MPLDPTLLADLLAIAVRLSGLAPLPEGVRPEVEPVPAARLQALACPDRPADCAQVAAWHDAAQGRVLVDDALDPRQDAVGRSFVVHELVHVLQAHRDGGAPGEGCAAQLAAERAAYAVQNAYLREQGREERYGGRLRFMGCAADDEPAAPDGMIRLQRGPERLADLEALFDDLMRRPVRASAPPAPPTPVRRTRRRP